MEYTLFIQDQESFICGRYDFSADISAASESDAIREAEDIIGDPNVGEAYMAYLIPKTGDWQYDRLLHSSEAVWTAGKRLELVEKGLVEARKENRIKRQAKRRSVMNKKAWYDTEIARVIDTDTGDGVILYRSNGATAPICMSGTDRCLGCWESRFEIFMWACDVCGFDPYRAEWCDQRTLEILTYDDLEQEELDELEELDMSYTSRRKARRSISRDRYRNRKSAGRRTMRRLSTRRFANTPDTGFISLVNDRNELAVVNIEDAARYLTWDNAADMAASKRSARIRRRSMAR